MLSYSLWRPIGGSSSGGNLQHTQDEHGGGSVRSWSATGTLALWSVSGGYSGLHKPAITMVPTCHRTTELPTSTFPDPDLATAVGHWRTRTLDPRRLGGLVGVVDLPDSHTPPSLIEHDPRLRPPRPGQVGAGPGPASVAGL